VLARSEQHYGPAHPAVARALHNLGNAHTAAADNARAEQEERRALAIRESALGPVHPDIAANLADLARTIRRQGRFAEALVLDRRSVAMGAQVFGAEHPAYAQQLLGLGITLLRTRQFAEADATMRRAEAIFTKLHGSEHADVMGVLAARADLAIAEHRWTDAIALSEHVIAVLGKAEAQGDVLPTALLDIAEANLQLGQPRRALPPLEQLARQLDQLPADQRIAVELTLARALWDSHGDRARARALAHEARDLARGHADTPAATTLEIDRWLAGH
ncbi:MAG TPA: tetratricopeptide repeat protein, partial [Kofleriaceae bacterium]